MIRAVVIAVAVAFVFGYAWVAEPARCLGQEADRPAPVVFTTREDQQNMLDQLGITRLRPGRDANPASPNAANEDETKANPYPKLPSLLTLHDGTPVGTPEAWWKARRPEIVEALEREVYGRIPPSVPPVRWEVRQTREIEAGGRKALEQHVVGVVDNAACPEIAVAISMSLTLPKDASGPVPVLMSFGWTPFEPSPFGFGNRGGPGRDSGPRPPSKTDLLIAAGWGAVTINPATVQDDAGGWQPKSLGPKPASDAVPPGAGLTRGIIGLTNRGQPRTPEQWGALRAWAWGASRGLDYLETVPAVDAKRVGIAGVSRYGKAALVTMAFDPRFAAGLIASSGKGGTVLFRRSFGESVENLASGGAYHWMAGNYLKYAAEEPPSQRRTADDLPVDSHMTLALCAPRLVFISHGVPERGDAHWLDHRGSFMAAIASQPVFRLLGAKDLGRSDDFLTEPMPAVKQGLLDGHLAWRQHDGGHTDGPNVGPFIAWADARWAERDGAADPDADRRSLREAAAGRFPIGVGVSHQTLENLDDLALLKRHFQIVTPENCMKPQSIHPSEATWRFDASDRFVTIARANGLDVVGHCLVWAKDDRTDAWMTTEPDGRPVTRETLLKRIEDHVGTVVGRYAEAATMWDVVNEAVADSGDSLLRDSVYSRTTGIDFVVTAFQAARAKDPDALLIYNDYNDQMPDKRRRIVAFLRELKAKGAPVDAYGMQGHFELGEDVVPQLRAMFDEVRALGLKVVISELDIDVVKRYQWWADNGAHREELSRFDPYHDGLPDEIQTQLADQYAALFRLFDENHDLIARVSFWNLHDGQSWLNDFPWKRVNHPLLFDRDRRSKPAFDAVYGVLSPAPKPIPSRHQAIQAVRPGGNPAAAVERSDPN
jgi:GH35 family endo-1,4-beta-xylanase